MYNVYELILFGFLLFINFQSTEAHIVNPRTDEAGSTDRERISLNAGWRFSRFTSNPDSLSYSTLKPWIQPSANNFVSSAKHQRPSGTTPGGNVTYLQSSFNDSTWETLNYLMTGPQKGHLMHLASAVELVGCHQMGLDGIAAMFPCHLVANQSPFSWILMARCPMQQFGLTATWLAGGHMAMPHSGLT